MKRAAAFKLATCSFERSMPTNHADQVSLAIQLLKNMVRNTHKDKYFSTETEQDYAQLLNLVKYLEVALRIPHHEAR